jgi:hypothetical protein
MQLGMKRGVAQFGVDDPRTRQKPEIVVGQARFSRR